MAGDGHPPGGRLLVDADGRVDRLHQVRGGLEQGHARIAFLRRPGALGDEVAQRAGLHALLTEAGQDVGDVGQVGLVRADEQDTAATVAEPGVGVEEVGRAVQRDHGLARARPAVDDEGAAGPGADDGVLVGLDGGEHVAHPGGPVAAQAGDERGLVVERRVSFERVGAEHLVPVVADPAAGPAVPATARETQRVGVGRREERLGGGGAPVEQQPAAGAVGEAEASHVHGFAAVGGDDAPQAQVQAEAAQGAQAGGQAVDLGVPVHGLPADAAGRPALRLQAVGEFTDRLREAFRDGREVPLVAVDQGRVGLGGEMVGKVERAAGPRSVRDRLDVTARFMNRQKRMHFVNLPFLQLLASVRDFAPAPGPCGKPPGAL